MRSKTWIDLIANRIVHRRIGRWTFHRMSSLVVAVPSTPAMVKMPTKTIIRSQWPWGWHSALQFLSLACHDIWCRLPYFTRALNFYTNQSRRARVRDKDKVWAITLNCVHCATETWEVWEGNLDTSIHRWYMKIWEYLPGRVGIEASWVQSVWIARAAQII